MARPWWIPLLLAFLIAGCGMPPLRAIATPTARPAPLPRQLADSPVRPAAVAPPIPAVPIAPAAPVSKPAPVTAQPTTVAPTPRPRTANDPRADCPADVVCDAVPVTRLHYSLANRPADGLKIRYIVIHDTEQTYSDALKTFQDPRANVSANYLIRSADGLTTQLVPNQDIAYHSGNWYINSHSIGIEREAFAAQGATWFTEAQYQATARLVRYLAEKYDIPLDRAHIIGHDNVPGLSPATQPNMHWDPGPFWDWAHLMDLLGAPIAAAAGANGQVVTIAPHFAANQPTVSTCDARGCHDLPAQSASIVYLHTAPKLDAPLIADPFLARLQASPGSGTTRIDDWGDTASTGQQFYRAEQQGDWTAIYFGSQQAWFYNPNNANTVAGSGTLVRPKAGRASIPVYGQAYPESRRFVPLGYEIPNGQVYVATDPITADYERPRSSASSSQAGGLVVGHDQYYQIFFNHRLAFVKASDVEVVGGK